MGGLVSHTLNKEKDMHHKNKRSGFALSAAPWIGATAGAVLLGSIALLSPAAPNSAGLPGTGDTAPTVADVCVDAFSKDICEGALEPVDVVVGGCPSSTDPGCRTAVVDAVWNFGLVRNEQLCSSDGRCDEAVRKDGRLTARINYTMRFNDPCPYRACFTGTWTLQCDDGSIYQGEVSGTMGVGSHRPSACDFGGRDCERCVDVEQITHTSWRIGTEATFVGRRVNSTSVQRDEICFSLSGDFIAPSSDDGVVNPYDGWRFAGTGDGTHVHCN